MMEYAIGLNSVQRGHGLAGMILGSIGLLLSAINALIGDLIAEAGRHQLVNEILK